MQRGMHVILPLFPQYPSEHLSTQSPVIKSLNLVPQSSTQKPVSLFRNQS
jgi:hypothetical protein